MSRAYSLYGYHCLRIYMTRFFFTGKFVSQTWFRFLCYLPTKNNLGILSFFSGVDPWEKCKIDAFLLRER